eukprot:GGOE01058953.1.p1 GENE.GGOE01058953.1~~GGOE01058953.1.p1  ORF type:complete len:720 (-),score=151.84 GGOE01058953.1:223-2382(-)
MSFKLDELINVIQRLRNDPRYSAQGGPITSREPDVAPLLQGLEKIFNDGLSEGSTVWDFVGHSQRTMAEDNRRKYNNPEAKEQVSEALALAKDGHQPHFLGRLWLVLCLNTHTLLDAVTSLMARRDIQSAYYQPTAFLSKEANFPTLYAMLNQLHKLRFKLFATDVQYFESTIIPLPLMREASPMIATIATISRKTRKKATRSSVGDSENGELLQRHVQLPQTSPEAALRLARLDTDYSSIDLSDDPTRALETMSDASHGSGSNRGQCCSPPISTPGPSDGGKRSGPGSDQDSAGAAATAGAGVVAVVAVAVAEGVRSAFIARERSLLAREAAVVEAEREMQRRAQLLDERAQAMKDQADQLQEQKEDLEVKVKAFQQLLGRLPQRLVLELLAWADEEGRSDPAAVAPPVALLESMLQRLPSDTASLSPCFLAPSASSSCTDFHASGGQLHLASQMSVTEAEASQPLTISLIVKDQPSLSRSQLWTLQAGRCPGCGQTLSYGLFGRLRRCQYTDRLFCSQCHLKETASLPFRVLSSWDFTKFPVCHAVYKYLTSNEELPNLHAADLHPSVLQKHPTLHNVQAVRRQLGILGEVIKACPNRAFAAQYNDCFWVKSADLYSMSELRAIHSGHQMLMEMLKVRNALLSHCKNQCEVCYKRSGRHCPGCIGGKELFPWNIEDIEVCPNCSSWYHRSCLAAGCKMSRCQAPRSSDPTPAFRPPD